MTNDLVKLNMVGFSVRVRKTRERFRSRQIILAMFIVQASFLILIFCPDQIRPAMLMVHIHKHKWLASVPEMAQMHTLICLGKSPKHMHVRLCATCANFILQEVYGGLKVLPVWSVGRRFESRSCYVPLAAGGKESTTGHSLSEWVDCALSPHHY